MSNNIFSNLIRTNKLKPPTDRRFDADLWKARWKTTYSDSKPSPRDIKVYEFGLIVHSLLDELRIELSKLIARAPLLSNEKIALAHVACMNREVHVALASAPDSDVKNLTSMSTTSTPMGSKITLSEIVHGGVDGLEHALRRCIKSDEGDVNSDGSNEPLEIIDFIQRESYLSQIYRAYEHLWQCVFWSDYDVEPLSGYEKAFCIVQPSSNLEIVQERSIIRLHRLSAQHRIGAQNPKFLKHFASEKLLVIRKDGKRRVAKIASSGSLAPHIQGVNLNWKADFSSLTDQYPEAWLKEKLSNEFSVGDVFRVMHLLVVMANDAKLRFPEDDSAYKLAKLLQFCPKVKSASLRRGLVCVTKLESDIVDAILEFLTYKGEKHQDLWCFPLIKTSEEEYALPYAVLGGPYQRRLAEHWFRALKINLSDKGFAYEQFVLDEVNKRLVENPVLHDYNEAVDQRIRLDSGQEEFDLIFRIGSVIIIGECKSIVTTDSEISKYRTMEVLEGASEQVLRKIDFFRQNIQEMFSRLGWNYSAGNLYSFQGCIVNSSRMFIGALIGGVPVVDEKILSAYFRSPNRPLLSSVDNKTDKQVNLAWYELYDSEETLVANLENYLNHPPQVVGPDVSFEYSDVKLPLIQEGSYRIIQRRLVPTDPDMWEVIKAKEHHFKVQFAPEFKELDKEMWRFI